MSGGNAIPSPRMSETLTFMFSDIEDSSIAGVLFLAATLGNLFIESICGCDPPRLMGLLVIGMLFSTAAWWLPRLHDPERTPSRYVMILGYATTAGAFAAGALRAFSDIQHLL